MPVYNPSVGGGGGTTLQKVDVVLDFGASFSDRAQTVVTGETWVSSSSALWVSQISGNVDESILLDMKFYTSDIVDGVGFTLSGYSQPEAKGTYTITVIGL